jgi:uncharacterized protein
MRARSIGGFSLAILLSSASWAAVAPDRRLVEAAKDGDRGAVTSLIAKHVNVNTPEADGTTAIAWAAHADDLVMADQLIRAGADVKAANRYGITPMYLACMNGSAGMIERLLKGGADANALTTEGETALMTAARSGSVDAVKVLLAHGAKVDAREQWRGQTALMWATAERHPDVMKVLIAHGADVNMRSAIQGWERQVTSEPREKWLPLGGFTPLLFAVRQGCVECERILLDAGADINVQDPHYVSALLMAIINGHYDDAGYLLDRGANPNLADDTGRTPLFSAVDFHTMPVSNRPSPNVIVNQLTSMELIQKLVEKGANVNAQLLKMQPYRVKLDRGDDTMLTTGTTPLLRAAKAGDVEVVKYLLDHGADPKLSTRVGINPLMAAAGVGTKEEDTTGRFKTEDEANQSIALLLKAGLDINAADGRGQTAVYGAALEGKDKIVKFLADHGAKLDVKDKRGFTPLDAALGKAGGLGFDGRGSVVHESTAALLRQLMAGPEAKNDGQTQ